MATNNIKIFDETKSNMLSNEAYGVNSQRLNGVQQGIASSQLQNKTLYQVSLVAYAIGQMMQANGFDANDELAVSAFCDNMSKSIMQKALDLVSVDDVTKFEDTKKYINPATWKAAFDFMKADSALIQSGTDDTHYVTPKGVAQKFGGGIELDDGTISKWNSIANVKIQQPNVYELFDDINGEKIFYYACAPNKSWYLILCIYYISSKYKHIVRLYKYDTNELMDELNDIGISESANNIKAIKANNNAVCFAVSSSLIHFHQITNELKFGKFAKSSGLSIDEFECEQDSPFEQNDSILYFAYCTGTTGPVYCACYEVSANLITTLTVTNSSFTVSNVKRIQTIYGPNKIYYIVPHTNTSMTSVVNLFAVSVKTVTVRKQIASNAGRTHIFANDFGLFIFCYYSNNYDTCVYRFTSSAVISYSGSISSNINSKELFAVKYDKNNNSILIYYSTISDPTHDVYLYGIDLASTSPTVDFLANGVKGVIKCLFYNYADFAYSTIYSSKYYFPLSFYTMAQYVIIDGKEYLADVSNPTFSNIYSSIKAPLLAIGGVKVKD